MIAYEVACMQKLHVGDCFSAAIHVLSALIFQNRFAISALFRTFVA